MNVITYNVLSSSLDAPSYFSRCKDMSLLGRMERIVNKIDPFVRNGSIICLQEVSLLFESKLITFFEEKGYHAVSRGYTSSKAGFMGVLIAYPRKFFTLLDTSIVNVYEDNINEKNELRTIKKNNFVNKFINNFLSIFNLFNGLIIFLKKKIKTEEIDVWELANRSNMMIMLRLRNNLGKTFVIGNYHMPCFYGVPQVMSIHTDFCMKSIKKFVEHTFEENYILCGDFNILPGTNQYNLLTTGVLNGDIPPNYQKTNYDILKSCYYQIEHHEPEFTNYAFTEGMKYRFKGCLDYIFYYGKNLNCIGVLDISKNIEKAKEEESLPSYNEPSDHLLIGATFDFD